MMLTPVMIVIGGMGRGGKLRRTLPCSRFQRRRPLPGRDLERSLYALLPWPFSRGARCVASVTQVGSGSAILRNEVLSAGCRRSTSSMVQAEASPSAGSPRCLEKGNLALNTG